MAESWKNAILVARQASAVRRRTTVSRTELARVFRRIAQTLIDPAFREVAEFASAQDVICTIDCELGGVQPRISFCVRASGRRVSYELDPDGGAVREVEGAAGAPLGQRHVWATTEALRAELTESYARAAAATIVRDHFRASA